VTLYEFFVKRSIQRIINILKYRTTFFFHTYMLKMYDFRNKKKVLTITPFNFTLTTQRAYYVRELWGTYPNLPN